MDIIYTWNIDKLISHTESEGKNDVVCTVFYTFNGTYKTYNGFVKGSISLDYDKDTDFIPYSDLTKDQVIEWVKSSLDQNKITEMEADIVVQIQDQISPLVVSHSLPWIGIDNGDSEVK